MTKKSVLFSLLFSLIVLVLGVIFLIWPLQIFQIIGYVIGGGLIVLGVWLVIRFFSERDKAAKPLADLVLGIVAAIAGVVLLVQPIEKLAPYIIAVFMLFCAFYYIKNAFEARSSHYGRWWITALGAVVFIILALICAFVFFESVLLLMRLAGGVMVAISLFNLITGLMQYSAARTEAKNVKTAATEPPIPVDISSDATADVPAEAVDAKPQQSKEDSENE